MMIAAAMAPATYIGPPSAPARRRLQVPAECFTQYITPLPNPKREQTTRADGCREQATPYYETHHLLSAVMLTGARAPRPRCTTLRVVGAAARLWYSLNDPGGLTSPH
jgi:hypothetical protein